jgi:DNA-binding response OmpR family regulator
VLYPLSYGGPGDENGISPVLPRPKSLPRVAPPTLVGMQRPPRVLVVDDTENVRRLIRVNLELEGMEVHVAVDGQDAIDVVGDVAPDLITLDVMMPRMDGLAAATWLKGHRHTASIPIVMVTARAQTADRQAGERAGVDAYLTTPFDPDELVSVVWSLLRRGS